jgi:hypothetical protein
MSALSGSIQETVAQTIKRAGRLPVSVGVGDRLQDLNLGRLGLIGVFISLEDAFGIEFPPDLQDRFKLVGDIGFYIQTRALAAYDDVAPDDDAILPAAILADADADHRPAWTRRFAAYASAVGHAFRMAGVPAAT